MHPGKPAILKILTLIPGWSWHVMYPVELAVMKTLKILNEVGA